MMQNDSRYWHACSPRKKTTSLFWRNNSGPEKTMLSSFTLAYFFIYNTYLYNTSKEQFIFDIFEGHNKYHVITRFAISQK